jgi:hypothetical protein
MKTVIIVSKCLSVIKLNQYENTYNFHFKGVCSGELLKKVVLRGSRDFLIQKGQEYLMYVQLVSCIEGTLQGNILKCKNLDECWDKS